MQVVRINQQTSSSYCLMIGVVAVIFMATLAATEGASVINSERAKRADTSDGTMEKPTYRTTSFVPRLGKREQKLTALDRVKIDRLLCAHYGLDCGRLLEELARATEPIDPTMVASPFVSASSPITSSTPTSSSPSSVDSSSIMRSTPRQPANKSPLEALIEDLAQGLATQEGQLKLAPLKSNTEAADNIEASLLNLLAQRLGYLAARDTRGSSDELFEALPTISLVGPAGSKRVAFTPRIG